MNKWLLCKQMNDQSTDDDDFDDRSSEAFEEVPGTNWTTIYAAHDADRIDTFLAKEIPHMSRARIQKLVEEGHVLLGGAKPKQKQKIQKGDAISYRIPAARVTELIAENIPLHILFEDEHLLIVNKPAGMVVHPAPGHTQGTLVNALLHHCGKALSIGGEQRPGIVHRIDKNTSGSIIVAKSNLVHQRLTDLFKEHRLCRRYLGLAWGKMPKQFTVEKPIGRDPKHRQRMNANEKGKAAKTFFQCKKLFHQASLFEAELYTGRTHQIRVHAATERHPLLGDSLYANLTVAARKTRTSAETYYKKNYPQLYAKVSQLNDRQMLHAWYLSIEHPITEKKLEIKADLPDDFQNILALFEQSET